MYLDAGRYSAREFANGIWQWEPEKGLYCQPFTFFYFDRAQKVGLGFSTFDWLIWRNRHFCDGFETVTVDEFAAGDYSEDIETVTDGRECEICGASLEGKRPQTTTCSSKCRKALSRQRRQ